MARTHGRATRQTVTIILGILTVVATLIAGVPAYQQLRLDRPDVYFEQQISSILSPGATDSQRVKAVLRANGIADSRVTIKLLNVGHGPAKEIRLGMAKLGTILDVATVPALIDGPVWVDLPSDLHNFVGESSIAASIKNFAPHRVLTVSVGYHSLAEHDKPAPTLDVFFDGSPATVLASVESAQTQTVLQTFKPSLYVLTAGAVITLAVSLIIVLLNNPPLAAAFGRILWEALKGVVPFH